ncbi:PREDICTED: uncharacterized protein LOC109132247 [Camelina sativa]|uniref:Uncharacterized protein LOC109132247 n=1 Tax=Camelina sativa TaxID=90675 RepID=A0ABM1RJG6_CAMSA|nr:PREDICTED: uncharacterized protein LOC109132247 [Camelina sativa]XP_019099155.1 PREDICTED: uncharacterized protein LOC109132247 [Camelina sativa]
MAAKTSNSVALLLSLFLLLLFVSSQVVVAEANRHLRNNLRLDCDYNISPPPPNMAPPIFVPPSRSSKGRGL